MFFRSMANSSRNTLYLELMPYSSKIVALSLTPLVNEMNHLRISTLNTLPYLVLYVNHTVINIARSVELALLITAYVAENVPRT